MHLSMKVLSSGSSSQAAAALAVTAVATNSNVPGLYHVRRFLSPTEQQSLFLSAREISKTASRLSLLDNAPVKTSSSHNLKSIKRYASVALPTGESCDHFNDYSEKGHSLSYFRMGQPYLGIGNGDNDENGDSDLLHDRIADLPNVLDMVYRDRIAATTSKKKTIKNTEQNNNNNRIDNDEDNTACIRKKPLQWKLTINRYYAHGGGATTTASSSSSCFGMKTTPTTTTTTKTTTTADDRNNTRVGFPWHRDLKTNGAVSVIVGVGARGILEFGLEKEREKEYRRLLRVRDQNNSDQPSYRYDNGEHPSSDDIVVKKRIIIEKGDAVVLGGIARWELLHRVLPEAEPPKKHHRNEDSNNNNNNDNGTITANNNERISLVFGIW